MPLTTVSQGLLSTDAQYTGFKNRLINGDMTFDQRNNGAAVTITNDTTVYTLDRWRFFENTDGVITAQQNTTAPAGFTNSLLVTVSTADTSIAAGQLAVVEQKIEGFNVADLGWGTANAQTVTLSFWVRSSLTGTFGGSLRNSNDTRSYPFSYTINSANTFEYKTVTIAGDTSGTWNTTNGVGLHVTFGLAVGSNFLGTAGSWSGSNLQSATGQANLLATIGNTFYLTGVQLEKGSVATSFDVLPIGTELQLCQRYFRTVGRGGAATPMSVQGAQYLDGNTIYLTYLADLTSMRALPTATLNGTANTDYAVYNSGFSPQTGFTFTLGVYQGFTGYQIQAGKSSHGLTNQPQLYFGAVTSSGFVSLSSEL